MDSRLRHKISCNIRLWLYKRGYMMRKIDEDIWVIRSKNDDRHLALLIRRADPKDFALTYAPDLNKHAQNRIRATVQYAISEYELPLRLYSSPYLRND
jgi:hypothetical protein